MSFTESLGDLVAQNANGLLSAHPSWGRVPLDLVFDVQNGFPFESKYFNASGHGIPLLRIRDVVRGSTETYYSGEYDPAFVVNRGEIVIGMDGDFNCRVWQGGPALLNQRVCRLIPRNDGYSSALVAQVLQGYLDAVNEKTSAITVKHLSSQTIKEIPLPLPPPEEQERIAEAIDSYLTRLDDAVASIERVQAKLKAYRASVLKAAVEGRLVPTEASLARAEKREYEPAEVLLDRILKERRRRWEEAELAKLKAAGKTPKDDKWKADFEEPVAPDKSTLAGLPEGWCWATIDQLAYEVTYGSSVRTSENSDGVPVLRMGNIVDGAFDLRNLKFLPRRHSEFPNLLLESGDMLFNRTNSAELVGKSAVYRGNAAPCSFASYLIRARFLTGAESAWIAHTLNSPFGRYWVASVASQQVGQANVNGSKLRRCAIPLPPHQEQVRLLTFIDTILSDADATAGAIYDNLRRCGRLRQAILRWAFEGKLVDQDPTDEPAERLLARIRAERAGLTSNRKSRGRQARGAA